METEVGKQGVVGGGSWAREAYVAFLLRGKENEDMPAPVTGKEGVEYKKLSRWDKKKKKSNTHCKGRIERCGQVLRPV